jgi:probable F420-dependent oxidoreductase
VAAVPDPRPFRFGIQLGSITAPDQWASEARRAEDLGFSTLFVPDHFGALPGPVPALMAAADATTTLRVGTLVFDNDYYHPVVLARDIATLDVLSGGRVEFGLGAGWMTTDYEQSGIPLDPPSVRVDRMEEAIAVFKGLFGEGAFSFEGQHYRITGLDAGVKPTQKPHPPLLIGGGGKRMLAIAGREADIVGINPNLRAGVIGADAAADATAAATDRKLGWLREAAGDRFDDIELNALYFMVIPTDDPASVAESMAPAFGLTPEEVAEVPHALIGTVDRMCEILEARRERWGFSYIVVQGEAMDAIAPVVERLAGK